ncbi:MAG: (2Fe-2S)-binding protein [Planctomycetes bacterium]|nr:(2Fe-2S)-binding protein [Planctomycetota bacterium]
MTERRGVSRRGFLKGLGAAAVTGPVGFAGIAMAAKADEEAAAVPVLGPGATPVRLKVNGKVHDLSIEPRVTLLDALRDTIGLTGPKEVCDRGACGGCTVLLDGMAVCGCMMLAIDVGDREVTTVEGLCGPDGAPSDLQQQFVAKDALQCGYCTCGMVTAAEGLLRSKPVLSPDEVRAGISGNLCRCGTYTRIVEAVIATSALRRKGK